MAAESLTDVGRVLVDVQRELTSLRQSITLPSLSTQQHMYDTEGRGEVTSTGLSFPGTGRVSGLSSTNGFGGWGPVAGGLPTALP